MSSMPTFCPLAELIDRNLADTPSPQCAYHVRTGNLCKGYISRKYYNEARSAATKHLDILTGPSGEYTDTSPLFKFLQNLANLNLCKNHKKYNSQAIAQWRNDLAEKRVSIIAQLKKDSNLRIDHGHAEKDVHDTSKVDFSGRKSTSDKSGFDGKSASGGEEDVSILSDQFSSPIGLLRRTLTVANDEVAKEITYLLERRLSMQSKSPGWIYAICPVDLPGIVKVGFTMDPPRLKRFQDHKKCYREFEVLITKLIPNVYLVEQLLLTEFSNKHYMLEDVCQGCGSCHRELLDVDKENLSRCLEKWISFVESCPHNNQGRLTKEAKERLPRPALKSYLGCKPTRRHVIKSPTPKKKGESEDSHIFPPPILYFTNSTSTPNCLRVHKEELNQDDLCTVFEDLQLTPSRHR